MLQFILKNLLINTPLKNNKEKTKYKQEVARKRFKARAAIEPTRSHLKRNHSLGLNFLKGVAGDVHNALLAGIGYNFKLRFNQIKEQIIFWLELLLNILCENKITIFVEIKNSRF